MIKSIFYTRFHAEKKGSRVLHQVPDGSVIPSNSSSALSRPYFDFPSISEYIIPRQDFCDRLVTVCISHYRIIGYPVCISDYHGKYRRNEFIFNFALVLEEDTSDWGSYASVVRKLGRLLRALEEQGGFLSKDEDPSWFDDDDCGWEKLRAISSVFENARSSLAEGDNRKTNGSHSPVVNDKDEGLEVADVSSSGMRDLSLGRKTPDSGIQKKPNRTPGTGGKVYALCEMILEDLNNYCECMIPIDDSNTINLKLFPTHPPPAPVFAWHVPLLTVDLSSFPTASISSDLTMTRILPHINGIRSVSRIAQVADTDLILTRKAIRHLVYYGCVLLLDIFQFSAIYAATPDIANFIMDDLMQHECERYVRFPVTRSELNKSSIPGDVANNVSASILLDVQAGRHSSSTASSEGGFDTGSSGDEGGGDDDDGGNRVCGLNFRERLVRLYGSIRHGATLRTWCLEHADLLVGVDVRRLITFGVIKGFLYRAHKFAIAGSAAAFHTTGAAADFEDDQTVPLREGDADSGEHLRHSSGTTDIAAGKRRAGADEVTAPELPLAKYLDGVHCFDEICTEMRMSDRVVMEKMKGFGDVQIIHR